ncbi:hypothetical protein DDR33_01360 [Pararcticibacter amylolyticus]|uniref:Uncharacterized protein n=1 Tax=Pararcticibacter amylolyticus TaxID=2173175 RepID=A0A2U2PMP0_9SPHI|nr:hypothetical protein DDR33_01360 [Pararcticibacter amylolyticus]
MKILHKSIRVVLSWVFLLHFSAVTLSLDFLHDHSSETTCQDLARHGSCSHKSHLSNNSSCWVCLAHFQKEAIKPNETGIDINSIPLTGFLHPDYTCIFISNDSLLLSLRGPPPAPSFGG